MCGEPDVYFACIDINKKQMYMYFYDKLTHMSRDHNILIHTHILNLSTNYWMCACVRAHVRACACVKLTRLEGFLRWRRIGYVLLDMVQFRLIENDIDLTVEFLLDNFRDLIGYRERFYK